MIKVVLWDIDNTLLDFIAAERAAIRKCFSIFDMGECTDEMLAAYSAVNVRWWERLERGERTKPEILLGRFREFFTRQYFYRLMVFQYLYGCHLGRIQVICD